MVQTAFGFTCGAWRENQYQTTRKSGACCCKYTVMKQLMIFIWLHISTVPREVSRILGTTGYKTIFRLCNHIAYRNCIESYFFFAILCRRRAHTLTVFWIWCAAKLWAVADFLGDSRGKTLRMWWSSFIEIPNLIFAYVNLLSWISTLNILVNDTVLLY